MSRAQRRYPPNTPGSSGATSSISHRGRCPAACRTWPAPAGARPRQQARVPRWSRGSGRAVAPRQDMTHPATGQPACPCPGPILLTALRPPRCSPESRTHGLTADPPSPRPLPRSAINPPGQNVGGPGPRRPVLAGRGQPRTVRADRHRSHPAGVAGQDGARGAISGPGPRRPVVAGSGQPCAVRATARSRDSSSRCSAITSARPGSSGTSHKHAQPELKAQTPASAGTSRKALPLQPHFVRDPGAVPVR